MSHRRIWRLAILLLLFSSFANPLSAQWKKFYDFGQSGVRSDIGVKTIYFLEDHMPVHVGFVGLDNGELWRTSDGGKSWTQVLKTSATSCFTFEDDLHGWLGTSGSAVYKTTDGGVTWGPVGGPPTVSSILYNPDNGWLFTTSWGAPPYYSTNGGTAWTQYLVKDMNGLSAISGDNLIMSTLNNVFYWSHDGGVNWLTTTMDDEVWQPLALPSGTCYAVGEKSDMFYVSHDAGAHWDIVPTLNIIASPIGMVVGDSDQLYIQTEEGVQASMDGGNTWSLPCGPVNGRDRRFFFAKNGELGTVFAGDYGGVLWIDSAGIKSIRNYVSFPDSQKVIAPACSKVDFTLDLKGESNCSAIAITALEVMGSPAIKSRGSLHLPQGLFGILKYPMTYDPNGSHWDTSHVHITYSVDGRSYDTTITLLGITVPDSTIHLSFDKLALANVNSCTEIDTAITILNSPCDTLTIVSGSLDDSSVFHAESQFPIAIDPGASGIISIRASSSQRGKHVATLKLRLRRVNRVVDTTIPLSIDITNDPVPALALPSGAKLDFGITSLCNASDRKFYFRNPLCAEQLLTRVAWVATVPEFGLISTSALPKLEPPGSIDSITVRFAPLAALPVQAKLRLSYEFNGTPRDTIISCTGSGLNVAGASVSPELYKFDTLLKCKSKELRGTLKNTGCTIAEITEIRGLQNLGVNLIAPKVGDKLDAEDVVEVRLTLDPQSEGALDDSLEIRLRSAEGVEFVAVVHVEAFILGSTVAIDIPNDLLLTGLAPCASSTQIIILSDRSVCDSLLLLSLSLTSGAKVKLGANILPITLSNGAGYAVKLEFSSTKGGVFRDTLHIHARGIDTLIPILLTFDDLPNEPLEVSQQYWSPVVKRCDQQILDVTIKNRWCDAVNIESAYLTALAGKSRYTIVGSSTGYVDAQGEVHFKLLFDEAIDGDTNAVLHIVSQSGVFDQTITLEGHLDTTLPRLDLSISKVSQDAELGTPMSVDLNANNAIESTLGLQKILLDITFNTDLLTVSQVSTATGSASYTVIPNGLSLTLTLPAGRNITAGEALASIVFSSSVTDSVHTILEVNNLHLNPGIASYENCVLGVGALPEPIVFQSTSECGDDILRRSMLKLPFELGALHPNPLLMTDDGFMLDVRSSVEQSLVFELVDAFGRIVQRSTVAIGSTESRSLDIPMPNAPSGMYLLSVSNGSYRQTRKVSVQR